MNEESKKIISLERELKLVEKITNVQNKIILIYRDKTPLERKDLIELVKLFDKLLKAKNEYVEFLSKKLKEKIKQ